MAALIRTIGLIVTLTTALVSSQQLQKVESIRASVNRGEAQPGDSIIISCEAAGFAPGDYISWYKEVVGPTGTPVVEWVADNVQLQEPYSGVKRYSVSAGAGQGEGSALFTFNITDAKIEDTGIYQCAAPNKEKNDAVAVRVFGPIKTVDFRFNDNATGDVLTLEEGEFGKLACYANGSVHVPHMNMYIGEEERDISSDFKSNETPVLHCGQPQGEEGKDCIIHSTSQLEFVSAYFSPTYHNDGKSLKCVATLFINAEPVDVKMAALKLNISYPPHIECSGEVEMPLDSIDQVISCRVFANPALNASTITWSWQDGDVNMDLAPDQRKGPISSGLSQVSDKQTDITLQFDQVKSELFRMYTLYVENDRGQTVHVVKVKEKVKDPNTGGSTSRGMVTCTSSLLTAFLTIVLALASH